MGCWYLCVYTPAIFQIEVVLNSRPASTYTDRSFLCDGGYFYRS